MKNTKKTDSDKFVTISVKDMNASAYVLNILVLSLTLVPIIFSQKSGIFNEKYWEDVYYAILYLFISFLMIVGPFFVDKSKWFMRWLSFLLGGWYFSGLIYILQNFGKSEDSTNIKDNTVYFKYLLIFLITITLITINRLWIKMRQ